MTIYVMVTRSSGIVGDIEVFADRNAAWDRAHGIAQEWGFKDTTQANASEDHDIIIERRDIEGLTWGFCGFVRDEECNPTCQLFENQEGICIFRCIHHELRRLANAMTDYPRMVV